MIFLYFPEILLVPVKGSIVSLKSKPYRKRSDMYCKVGNPSIDVGLFALCLHANRDESLSVADIADVCDCHPKIIWNIEKSALNKLAQHPMARHLLP